MPAGCSTAISAASPIPVTNTLKGFSLASLLAIDSVADRNPQVLGVNRTRNVVAPRIWTSSIADAWSPPRPGPLKGQDVPSGSRARIRTVKGAPNVIGLLDVQYRPEFHLYPCGRRDRSSVRFPAEPGRNGSWVFTRPVEERFLRDLARPFPERPFWRKAACPPKARR